MAGLVSYASSDEEEVTEVNKEKSTPPKPVEELKVNTSHVVKIPTAQEEKQGSAQLPSRPELQDEDAPMVGPVRQSSVPLGPSLPPLEGTLSLPEPDNFDPEQPAASPYTARRTMMHNLTLPSVANLDIPPSPPGSPPEGPSKKFQQFLDLKKKGVHFNSKLENSSALKNPSLMDKLMAFVEMEGIGQYDTTLPAELWDPSSFPEWAYREPLKKSREKITKAREAEKATGCRTAVDFVPAKASASTGSASTASSLARGEKRKGGWK